MEINNDWEPKRFFENDLAASVIVTNIQEYERNVEEILEIVDIDHERINEFKNELIIEAAFVEVHFPKMQHGRTRPLDNAEKQSLLDGFAERQLENLGELEDEYIQEIDSQVKNYRSAQKFALDVDEALTTEVVKEIHKLLLIKVEGKIITSEFRNENVSTGLESTTHYDHTDVEKSLKHLIGFVNGEIYRQNGRRTPYAIAAYFLYKFYVIHPFLDGNGRLGRIIASAILYWCGLQFLVVLWFPKNPKDNNVFIMRKKQEKRHNSCLKKLSRHQTEYYGGNLAYMFLKSHCQTLKRFVDLF